jgi:lipopolysaccharide transport system ATP-binding protein
MQLRLAFSVAAYLEPDILVVDEVLAVGDLEFQKKCIGKMEEVSINQGRTVLLVSHNMGAIKKLCKKCILIEKGVIKNIDTPKLVIDQYTNRNLEMKTNVWLNRNLDKNKVLLKKIEILSSEGLPKVQFFNSQEVFIRLSITSLENIENFTIALDLIKNDEIVLRSRQIDFLKKDNIGSNKSYEFTCRIPKWFLNTGTFTIKPYLSIHCVESLFDNPDALVSFNVELDPERSKYHNVLNKSNHPGFIFPTLEWKYNEV